MRNPRPRTLKRKNRYYWVVDQAEFSTDLIFTSREALAGLYPRLLDHAAVNFSAKDILTFLGRRGGVPETPYLSPGSSGPVTRHDVSREIATPSFAHSQLINYIVN